MYIISQLTGKIYLNGLEIPLDDSKPEFQQYLLDKDIVAFWITIAYELGSRLKARFVPAATGNIADISELLIALDNPEPIYWNPILPAPTLTVVLSRIENTLFDLWLVIYYNKTIRKANGFKENYNKKTRKESSAW